MSFNAKIINGKPDFGSEFNQARFRSWCKEREGRIITINDSIPSRTNEQNRFYWAYLDIISRETGDDPNSLHEFFKRKLLPPKFIKALGEEIKIPASTTKLNKIEMGDYLDRICELSGVPIPDPTELEGYIPH
jgi:hypothetical protein